MFVDLENTNWAVLKENRESTFYGNYFDSIFER